jgi:polyhydroxybutyrate depolymerase
MQTNRFLITAVFVSLVFALIACRKKHNPSNTEYRISSSMIVDARVRPYLINLPPDYYESSDFSLVIGLHGGGGNGEQFETSTNLTAKANLKLRRSGTASLQIISSGFFEF